MCTEPGGQTVAYLRLIWDEPSVQDHCMHRGWLVFDSYGLPHVYKTGGQTGDSYEVTHVYKARWTDGGLPPTHLRRAVCPRPLHGQRVVGL